MIIFNFYRIEGHQGRVYREALEEITKIKEEKGLSFDVKVLSVETDKKSIDIKKYKCQFEDLTILLDAWKAEQDCVLSEVSRFLSAFKTDDAGKNTLAEKRKEKLPDNRNDEIKKNEKELIEKLKGKMTDEEVSKAKGLEIALKELRASGHKEEEKVLRKEFGSYMRGLFEAKLSEETPEKRKELETILKRYEDSAKLPLASGHSTVSHRGITSHLSLSGASTGELRMSDEEAAKKHRHDAMWKSIGYVEMSKEEGLGKRRYDDVWSKIGIGNIKAASDREKKRQKNIVKEVLNNEENTVGKTFGKVLKENPKASKNEILALVKKEMIEVSKTDTWQEKEGMKRFILEDVTEVLVDAYVLDKEIPKEIIDIDKDGLTRYKMTINELCERVKKLQSSYDTLDLDEGIKQITGLLINQLSSVCCSGKKLEVLYEEIQKRKDNIIVQTQLSEFVKKHPGLEHKAGVIPGGTFVMVYLKEAEEEKAVYENVLQEIKFAQQPEVREGGLGGERGFLQLWEDKYQITFTFVDQYTEESEISRFEAVVIGETLEETVKNFSQYLNKMFDVLRVSNQVKAGAKDNILYIGIVDQHIQEKTSFIQFQNPATVDQEGPIYFKSNKIEESSVTVKNTVVADFSLPYMCCSDCAPVNFIIPKEPVKLFLPEKHVCLKEGETIEPMKFKVSPADGEIAAIVPKDVPSGLTFDEHGRAFFDATLTDPSLHGKVIGFTVDEELTDCTVVVYGDVQLSVTTTVRYNTTKTAAKVVYKVSNVYPNLKHNWNFGNGEQSNQVPNIDGIVVGYQLPLGDDNIAKPTLKISNEFCEKEILIDPIQFEDPITDVSLAIIETYCLDMNGEEKIKIPFTNKDPQDGVIAFENGTIEGLQIVDDHLVITTQKFKNFDQPIKFTLGGLPTNAKITIGQKLKVEIIHDQTDYQWIDGVLHQLAFLGADIPNNVDPNSLIYKWSINGQQVGEKKSITGRFPLKPGTQSFEVVLEVASKINGCVTTSKINVTYTYPRFKITTPENKTEFCLNDKTPYLLTVTPEIKNTVVNGNGVFLDPRRMPQFIASRTGLTSEGEVTLSIAGQNLLKLKLKEASKASFTYKLSGETLVLTNTTAGKAEKYEFNVGGLPFPRSNKLALKIPITRLEGSKIDITLTAFSECGQDSFTIKNVVIREDVQPNACVEETLIRIKNDRDKLPEDVDLPTDVRMRIIMPTISIYDTVLAAPPEVLNNGNTSELGGFASQFSNTAAHIEKFIQMEYERGILSQYFIGQVKLFFNMMHCQPHEALKTDQGIIMEIMQELRKNLERLLERQIKFDPNGELRQFLKVYGRDTQVIKYIRTGVNEHLLPLIL